MGTWWGAYEPQAFLNGIEIKKNTEDISMEKGPGPVITGDDKNFEDTLG